VCMEQVLPLLFSWIIRTKESFSAFLSSSLLWISYYFTPGYILVSKLWFVNLTSYIYDIENNLLFFTPYMFYVMFSKDSWKSVLPTILSEGASYKFDRFKTREC
jgi:hypothetical protein